MGVYSSTPRTWAAGEELTASLANSDIRDPIKALADAWTAYTPTWTAATSNPAIGNGTIAGGYTRVNKHIEFFAQITMGSSTTYGTGQWRLTLPVTPSSHLWMFNVTLRDTGTANYTGSAVYASGGYLELFAPATTAGAADRSVASTVPHTWANTDVVFISGVYEAA